MTGLIDGSLSTPAPIFAVALATHRPQYAFFAGLATRASGYEHRDIAALFQVLAHLTSDAVRPPA